MKKVIAGSVVASSLLPFFRNRARLSSRHRCKMSDDGIEKWFLIDTEKEFCIVKEEAVVYDDSVDVGDKVNFFWTKRMELSGTVLAIGKLSFS